MGCIKTVQKHTITLGNTVTSNSAALTGLTNYQNCVPFITHRSTSGTDIDGDWGEAVVDVEITSTPTVVVSRTRAPDGGAALVVEVTVVEFDSSRCSVEQKTFSIDAASATDAVSITSVGATTDAFVIVHGKSTETNGEPEEHFCAAHFSSITEVTLTRGDTSGALTGHFYVVVSDESDFAVQHEFIERTTETTIPATIDSITVDKTCLFGSSFTTNSGGSPRDFTFDLSLTNATTITANFPVAGSDVSIRVQAVTFDTTTSKVVWRGIYSDVTDQTSDTIDLGTSVDDMGLAMAQSTADQSGFNCACDSTNGYDGPVACIYGLTLTAADELTVQHLIGDGGRQFDLGWEVIQWEEAAAAGAPRRVMVIS